MYFYHGPDEHAPQPHYWHEGAASYPPDAVADVIARELRKLGMDWDAQAEVVGSVVKCAICHMDCIPENPGATQPLCTYCDELRVLKPADPPRKRSVSQRKTDQMSVLVPLIGSLMIAGGIINYPPLIYVAFGVLILLILNWAVK